jgi:hypothetical protein
VLADIFFLDATRVNISLRASLGTPFFQGIPIFPKENGVLKLALRACLGKENRGDWRG